MEKMLEGIVERLEKKNLLDKTVIVLAGDHVPYDNMEVVAEYEPKLTANGCDKAAQFVYFCDDFSIHTEAGLSYGRGPWKSL